MKPLASACCMLLFSMTFLITSAQSVAPGRAFFTAYPDVINCNSAALDNIFNAEENETVNIPLATGFSFAGTVTCNVIKYSNLQSVIVKSPAFGNAIFSISKRTNPDNSITFVGRILNQSYTDGYELKCDAKGNYRLIKIQLANVIQTCTQ